MNNLSWFIYFTGVADNIGFCCGLILAVGGICGVICGGIYIAYKVDGDDFPLQAGIKPYILIMATAAVIGTTMPDRRTLLLIAGSEIGDRAIKSPSTQDIINPGMDLLKTWIKRETEKLASEKSK